MALDPSEAQRPKKTWGVLTIVNGSIADAPRRIELWKDKTKLGRDPKCMFRDIGRIRNYSNVYHVAFVDHTRCSTHTLRKWINNIRCLPGVLFVH